VQYSSSHWTGILPRLAALLSCLTFFILQLNHALYLSPLTDDAWMASVAKNFAFGYGWSTSIGRIMPFDADITTGPALLLPLAAAINLLGNAIWLPRLFSLLWNSFLLGLLLWRLRTMMPADTFRRYLILLPLLYGGIHWQLWIFPLGDVTAFLYTALGAVLVAQGVSCQKDHLLYAGALSLSFACLSKTVALVPAIITLTILPAALLWLGSGQNWQQLLSNWLKIALPFALPLLAWQWYQHQALAALPEIQRQLIEAKLDYNFAHSGSGLAGMQLAWRENGLLSHIIATTLGNFQRYTDITGNLLNPLPFFFPLFCLALATTLMWTTRRHTSPLRLPLLALALPAMAYLGWAVCFGTINFGRFISFALLLGLTALALPIASRRWATIASSIFLIISAALFSPQTGLYGIFYEWQPLPSAQITALQRVRDVLNNQYANERLASCSSMFAREVEYALPSVNRIEDCSLLLGDAVAFDLPTALQDERYRSFFSEATAGMSDDQDKLTAAQEQFVIAKISGRKDIVAPVIWHYTPPDFIVVINPVSVNFTNFGRAAHYRTITDACRENLYQEDGYLLLRCRGTDVRAAIDARGGIEFIPLQWQDALWLRKVADH
jgi:hypothetical protein